ncbi:DUF1761 domain-containing protein [Oceanihabitans sediminis]|uniref:DUF1761 domain-containing protein n=1 Tax=Oceanihabitans sediminis TaxID=1812012 RepID=A0A368P7C4_9FLAO|nr:DUF1761 domain-containing protein [Oceanihabitans sediminis]MDX1278700.1 DUF1761 domain-containing protein [Oceanihabitans sediminis]MDX1773012.1 DUF1761 domain-containing protein [Oceanihabitans sediminis]RBP34704.1 uncharacterized protein DUF1761 [Oceanihabitans sediminis]RCU58356.1 DUF1761 domain-containing protein [Oceanihabitans sediminis]
MQLINPWAIPIAAVSALLIGAFWYNPKVFGTVWMRESGMTEEKIKGGNMAIIFGLSLVFSALLAFLLMQFTNHQFGALGMIGGDATNSLPSYVAFMEDYGSAFRTFKHGALHGAMFGVLGALPILGTNALFERKSFRYIFINAGYWILTLTVMGALLCGL